MKKIEKIRDIINGRELLLLGKNWMEKFKFTIYPDIPIIERDVPVEILVGLYNAGIAREVNTPLFGAITGILNRQRAQVAVENVEDWRVERFREVVEFLEKQKEEFADSQKRMALVEEEPSLQRVPVSTMAITERCNRGCIHCGLYADNELEEMPFGKIEENLGLIQVPRPYHLTLSVGENLIYNSDGKDFADVLQKILEKFPHIVIEVITSGLSIGTNSSQRERTAAEKIANFNEKDKKRITMLVSTCSFMKKSLDMAKRAIVFFIQNNIDVRCVPIGCTSPGIKTANSYASYFSKILEELGIKNSFGTFISECSLERAEIVTIGRAEKNRDRIIERIDKFLGGEIDRKELLERVFINPYSSWQENCPGKSFTLLPDSSLIPDCCAWPAVFLRCGSIKDYRGNPGFSTRLADLKQELKKKEGKGHDMNSDGCRFCIDWFVKNDQGKSGIGIRERTRFERIYPAYIKIGVAKAQKIRVGT